MLLLFPYLGRMIIDNLLTFLAIKLLHVNIKMSQQNRVLCSDKSSIQTKRCVLYLIHESVLSLWQIQIHNNSGINQWISKRATHKVQTKHFAKVENSVIPFILLSIHLKSPINYIKFIMFICEFKIFHIVIWIFDSSLHFCIKTSILGYTILYNHKE